MAKERPLWTAMSARRELDAPVREASPASSESWAHRLRRGEAAAVLQVRERVCRILAYRGLGIPKAERDDVEQEIMMQVWQAVNRPDFDASAGFWGFVEVVSARRCIDWVRGHRVELPLRPTLRDRRKGPFQRTLDGERVRLIAAAVAELDPPCRELISLHLDQGRSYRQLSRILGKSEGTLRVQMYRCIRSARRSLKKLGYLGGGTTGRKGDRRHEAQ